MHRHTTLADAPSFDPLIDTRRTFAAEGLGLQRKSSSSEGVEFIHHCKEGADADFFRWAYGLRAWVVGYTHTWVSNGMGCR